MNTGLNFDVKHENIFKLIHDDNQEQSTIAVEDDVQALPDGYIEEKIQVDRRKLEKMITGNDDKLPSAFEYFAEVERKTDTQISWPSKLKIGAKTKKDPFVKIIGLIENVERAKDRIVCLLKVKRDRITLKLEISHTSHSHIIGRRGRNTQDVMRETNCHIHFPDSNKHNDVEKNNQVSIAGGIQQVEQARSKLRSISPVCINVNVEISNLHHLTMSCQEMQRKVACPETISQVLLSGSSLQLTLKSSSQFEEVIASVVNKFLSLLNAGGHATDSAICLSSFDLRPTLLQPNYGLFDLNTIRWIAFHTKTQMQFSPQGSSILVLGAIASVFAARRYLTGLLPISIQFEKRADSLLSKQTINCIESKYNVTVGEKKKSNGSGSELLTVIKSCECNIGNVYAARQDLLQADPAETVQVFEYQFMNNFFEKVKEASTPAATTKANHHSHSALDMNSSARLSPLLAAFANDSKMGHNFGSSNSYPHFNSERTSPVFLELCKSRDPELPKTSLTDKPKSELWRAPGLERQLAMDRDKMLLKANQATYGQEIVDVRQPTDMWSGYGFSNSLPADILKLGLKQIWEQPENTESGFGATTSINREMKLGRTPMETSAGAKGKGLAAVREEEELSDYNQSLSSTFSSPSQTTKDFPLQPFFKRPAFAASASAFESSPSTLNNDSLWDIEIFVDPAMVLSQLGCSEYLPQFRDQEIDMQAFLLLDEQNLKDIGVSTMGARKKIFNAILKLRDSAQKHGYSI